jgi:hypothetical protein
VIIYIILKIPRCMTKYFDKLLKIIFYIIGYPSHQNMKNNVILGHVDFFWNSLDITKYEYISLLNVKESKNKIHLNKHLSKSLNLNVLIIFQALIFYLIWWFQGLWKLIYFLGSFLNEKNSPSFFLANIQNFTWNN